MEEELPKWLDWPWNQGLSDKWTQGYMPVYMRIAAELGPSARVCELGVSMGMSLKAWKNLFPMGKVVGVDIDEGARWPEGTFKVVASQADPELPGMLDHQQFDLIVDDASHLGDLTALAFGNLWPLVAPGGYYVIEDWWVSLIEAGQFYGQYADGTDGGKMLLAVSEMLRLLDAQDAECDEVVYRYGLAIAHKRKP